MKAPLIEFMMRNSQENKGDRTAQKVGYSKLHNTNRYYLIKPLRPTTQFDLDAKSELTDDLKSILDKC